MRPEVITIGRVDRWLSKPFGWVIRGWCKATGTTATWLARLAAIVSALCAVAGDILTPGAGWQERYLFPATSLVFTLGLVTLLIPRCERHVDEVLAGQPSLGWLRMVAVAAYIRVMCTGLSLVDVEAVAIGEHNGLWQLASLLLLVLCFYCITTVSLPGRTIRDRLPARRVALRPA